MATSVGLFFPNSAASTFSPTLGEALNASRATPTVCRGRRHDDDDDEDDEDDDDDGDEDNRGWSRRPTAPRMSAWVVRRAMAFDRSAIDSSMAFDRSANDSSCRVASPSVAQRRGPTQKGDAPPITTGDLN
eukprot:Selendium_serpulae@DN6903_c0_g1_i1.p1